MKYIITKTDISLNGVIHSEGSIIDSTKYNQKTIDSISHLLLPIEKPIGAISLDVSEDKPAYDKTAEQQNSKKRTRSTKK